MPDDPFDDPEWKAYAQHARETLEPMVKDSAVCMSIVPDSTIDPKMAMETGYMIMLDKPIIAIVRPGARLPRKFAMVVDEIVEGEITDPDFQNRLHAAMSRVAKKVTGEKFWREQEGGSEQP
jgi:nucleoside 2-deoxyribosyltransferase